MGSRSKNLQNDLAYIAGFLDGDGSLMLQLKKRADSKVGWRFMCTICFYQDSRHEKPLHWMRTIFGIGYLSQRNDGITELRINGYRQVRDILKLLLPFIRFKEKQARALYSAADFLAQKPMARFTVKDRKQLLDWILTIQSNNYKSHSRKTKKMLQKVLDLTP